jgi:hypothetical protein
MGRHLHINLVHLAWPVSVLKFNQAICEMQSGDSPLTRIEEGLWG